MARLTGSLLGWSGDRPARNGEKVRIAFIIDAFDREIRQDRNPVLAGPRLANCLGGADQLGAAPASRVGRVQSFSQPCNGMGSVPALLRGGMHIAEAEDGQEGRCR